MNDEMQPTKPFSTVPQTADDGPWVRQAQTVVHMVLNNGMTIRVMSDPVEITDAEAMELAFKRDAMAPQASLLEVSVSHVISKMPDKPWYAAKALGALRDRFREIDQVKSLINRARHRGTEGSRQIAAWLEKLLAAWNA